MFTDDEVRESLKAVVEDQEKKEKSERSWKEVEVQRRSLEAAKKERRKHEHGIVGELHPNFIESTRDIFNHLQEEKNPSVNMFEISLTHFYPIITFLKELTTLIGDVSPDIRPKVSRSSLKKGMSQDATLDLRTKIIMKKAEYCNLRMRKKKQ